MSKRKIGGRPLSSRRSKLQEMLGGEVGVIFCNRMGRDNSDIRKGFLIFRTYPQSGYFLGGTNVQIPLNCIKEIIPLKTPVIYVGLENYLTYNRGVPR